MPTLTVELARSSSGLLQGFGRYCEEHGLPDCEIRDGLSKAAAAFPEVRTELEKQAGLPQLLGGIGSKAMPLLGKAVKPVMGLGDEVAAAAGKLQNPGVAAAARQVTPGMLSKTVQMPPMENPGVAKAVSQLGQPAATGSGGNSAWPQIQSNLEKYRSAPPSASSAGWPALPLKPPTPTTPATVAAGPQSFNDKLKFWGNERGGVPAGGSATPTPPPQNPWAGVNMGGGSGVPPVPAAPAAGPSSWGQSVRNVGINTAIGAGTGYAASGGDPTAAVMGGLVGGGTGGRGSAASAGGATGLLSSITPKANNSPAEQPIPLTNSAGVTDHLKGNPQAQQQLHGQLGQMEQQFLSTYKPGSPLTPEHHQQLQQIAMGRTGLAAAQTGKTPQELGAGAEQLYHKLTTDGVLDMNDLGQIVQTDAGKQALKDFAAQQQAPPQAPGAAPSSWTLDPQTLFKNFGEMLGSHPEQAAALALGIPLALYGAYSSMTGGGIGGLLSLALGGSLAAFGAGAFQAGGFGGQNLFAAGQPGSAASQQAPQAAPAGGPPAANVGPLVGTQAAWAMSNPQAAGEQMRAMAPPEARPFLTDAVLQDFLKKYSQNPQQAMQELAGKRGFSLFGQGAPIFAPEQLQQIQQWLQAKDPSVQAMGGNTFAAPSPMRAPGMRQTQTMMP